MAIQRKNKYIVIFATLIAFLISGLYLRYDWNVCQNRASSEAIQLAQSLEALLPSQLAEALLGSADEVEPPEYIIAKTSLMRLVGTTSSIRFAYLMREQNGNLVFLMDSESPESPDYSPPGQVYEEADDWTWGSFRTGEPVITPPTSDRWGTWVSALVPIKDPESGETIAIFGIDYSADEWYAALWKQMIPSIVIVFVLLILCFSLLYIWNQRSRLNRLNKELDFDKALYRSVFDQAPIGVAVMEDKSHSTRNRLGDITINLTFQKILGRNIDDLRNMTWAEITYTEDLAADTENFDQLKTGKVNGYTMEKRFVKPDGSVAWTNMSVSPLLGINADSSMHLCLIEDISERKQSEIALQTRIKLETAIAAASRLFVSQNKSNVNEVLELIGEAVSVNRSYVFKLKQNGEKIDNLYEWCDHNTEPEIDRLQDIDSAIFPWWINQLQGGNNIIFSDIGNLPPEAVREKAILQEQNIKSIFVAPIQSANGKLTGFMGFDNTENHRDWSAEDAKVLRIIAEMIGMYWDRINSEDQLRKSLENTQSMINNHEAAMFLIEPLSGKIIDANRSATEFYGYAKEEFLNMTIQDINALDKDEV